ncbi:hypothetical protein KOM00_20355 [Geomonas sp. Red69]|uniref:hypothetical protein n=1 Tax=Geomonas diazotrophica TaxID=2843197 RepID=UPI001C11C746|nr:hypothetical protein [Geomonas diazotrophica]MBU5639078.1 hypothetical protein [Geomonas diazotrophica]
MQNQKIPTETIIENRLQYMAAKVESLNTAVDIVNYAEKDRYVRICGASLRAVSLRDDYPLCGCAKTSSQKVNSIIAHFEKFEKQSQAFPKYLTQKEERRLQNWIIKESLKKNRCMLMPLIFLKNVFDEVKFALDEVSLGDIHHPVCSIEGTTWARCNDAGPNIVRCDILAVGRIGSEVFPVIVELKSNRSMTRLTEQLNNFSELMIRFEKPFRQLLNACTGMEITNFTPKKIMIWPLPPQRGSMQASRHLIALRGSGIIVGEYNRGVFGSDPVAWENLYLY